MHPDRVASALLLAASGTVGLHVAACQGQVVQVEPSHSLVDSGAPDGLAGDASHPHDGGGSPPPEDAGMGDAPALPDAAPASAAPWDDEARYASCGVPSVPDAPIVLTGAQTPTLLGSEPESIAAFRWEGGWVRVPIQVDERRQIAWPDPQLVYVLRSGWDGIFDHDDDPLLDADDELALPREALGEAAPGGVQAPAGAIGPGLHLRLVAAGEQGHAYLFRSAATVAPWSEVTYARRDCGTNPEDSSFSCGTPLGAAREDTWVRSPCYRVHFAMNWVLDALHVMPGAGGDDTDLIDRWKGRGFTAAPDAPFAGGGEHEDHREQVGKGLCGWSEVDGAHYYAGHSVGPVRAIRTVRGACSYTNTIRTWVFYRTHIVDQLLLRGHSMPTWMGGIGIYWDYSAAAAPLRYRHASLDGTLVFDGIADFAAPNVAEIPLAVAELGYWEQVTSAHGSLLFATRQTIPFSSGQNANRLSLYLLDDAGHDDGSGAEPGLIGGHGVRFVRLQDTEQHPAGLRSVIRPSAANLPDSGEAFQHAVETAVDVDVTAFEG